MVKKQGAREAAAEALVKKSAAKKVPFAFVLDELAPLDPATRLMFGTVAVYVGPRIVMALRDRGGDDDGVWIATTAEHHASLRKELPSLRSIRVFGEGESGWQVIPAEGDGFEEEALRACELVRRGDPRVGKVPKAKKKQQP